MHVEDGSKFLSKFTRLYNGLVFHFPKIPWISEKFTLMGKKSSQRLLYTVLQTLISAENLIFEDYLHPDILWNSDQHVSFDVFVLKYNLAFEYQGEQHYHDLSRFYGMNSRFLLNFVRDEVKRVKCQNMGITLVVVPYWWNGQPDSLVRLISLVQPNFLGSFSQNLLNKC
eukprot:TRINITY_DN11269_c0_g1_i1.p1 TRINITY_DN11269_c0_g1~~TRINITY_DN11269_c0_g1_i1.p1  ORF type:complete len:170 (-),score=28.72 TRINITY_DN11269_c0_g1_i1:103-612(-)